MPRLGVKWSIIFVSIPAILGWICLTLARTIDHFVDPVAFFYIGRLLTGFGGGAFMLLAPIYVADIAEARIRGSLGSLLQLNFTMGICFVNALSINDAVHWDIIAGICIVFPGMGLF